MVKTKTINGIKYYWNFSQKKWIKSKFQTTKKKTIPVVKVRKKVNVFDRYNKLMGKYYDPEREEKVFYQLLKEGYTRDEANAVVGN